MAQTEGNKVMTADDREGGEIDRMIDDMIVVDPYERHAPSRRSDKELGRLLGILDALETENNRKEIEL